MKFFSNLLIISTIITSTLAQISIDFDIDFHPIPCMPDEKFHIVDFSNITLISDWDAKKVYINGTIQFIKDLDFKYQYEVTSERFHMGQWESGIIQTRKDSICAQYVNPLRQPMAYRLASRALKQKSCPFKAGHVESFNMFSASEVPIVFTSDLIDPWRVYFKWYQNKRVVDCVLLEFDIID